MRPPRGHIPSSSLPRAPGMFLAELAQQHPAVTPLPPRVQEPPHHHHRSPGATPAPGDTALLPGLSQSYPFLEPPLLTDRCRRRWGHLGTWRVPAWPLAVLTNCSEALSQRALLRLVTGAASPGVSLQSLWHQRGSSPALRPGDASALPARTWGVLRAQHLASSPEA